MKLNKFNKLRVTLLNHLLECYIEEQFIFPMEEYCTGFYLLTINESKVPVLVDNLSTTCHKWEVSFIVGALVCSNCSSLCAFYAVLDQKWIYNTCSCLAPLTGSVYLITKQFYWSLGPHTDG